MPRWSGWIAALVVVSSLVAHVGALAAPAVSLGPNSRLPYPTGADVWVDGAGTFNRPLPALPGGAPGMLVSASFIVMRPKDDNLKPEQLASIYSGSGYLPNGAQPVFKAAALPTADSTSGNAKETFVYRSRSAGKWLVLGLIRNMRTQHQLASVVILSGTLDILQAVAEANRLVELYAGEAQRRRSAPPMPTGTVAAGPTARWEGPKLAQLLNGIVRDPAVSARVKEMARTVIPQAVSINYSSWRTPTPLTDAAFLEFFTQQGTKLGWGAPVSTDESQPGRPTLLFQRPNNQGYVMIRAQPSPPPAIGAAARPSTTIIVLDLEGKKSDK
ncbi:MAG: hypothetical protein ACO1SX_14710 [Actinomycetota bacterium]